MMTTTEAFAPPSYARVAHFADAPIEEVRFLLDHALGQEGFAVLAEMDLADVLNRSLDEHRRPYFVLEVSHAKLAEEGLAISWEGGLLLPCRICVWQQGKDVAVATLPASRVVLALGRPHLDQVAREIEERLERVFARLSGPTPTAFDVPAPTHPALLGLDPDELAVLRDAAQRQIQVLLAEAAGTESHSLQRAIARNIDQLEALSRKLSHQARTHA
jgi:uncharacterized protein (DUF302 family)